MHGERVLHACHAMLGEHRLGFGMRIDHLCEILNRLAAIVLILIVILFIVEVFELQFFYVGVDGVEFLQRGCRKQIAVCIGCGMDQAENAQGKQGGEDFFMAGEGVIKKIIIILLQRRFKWNCRLPIPLDAGRHE